jgi:8-oxo-dGTP pyrophosphatase MutT (NUDIX family)
LSTIPATERDAVRIVLLDADRRVLLLHTRDLSNPNFGLSWELPGGGLEGREEYVDAAVRELHQETGLLIDRRQVHRPTWRRDVSFVYRGERRLQHEVIAVVELNVTTPAIDESGRVGAETAVHFEHRWWTLAEIVASGERFFPRSLPALLPRALAGEHIVEPLEYWP